MALNDGLFIIAYEKNGVTVRMDGPFGTPERAEDHKDALAVPEKYLQIYSLDSV